MCFAGASSSSVNFVTGCVLKSIFGHIIFVSIILVSHYKNNDISYGSELAIYITITRSLGCTTPPGPFGSCWGPLAPSAMKLYLESVYPTHVRIIFIIIVIMGTEIQMDNIKNRWKKTTFQLWFQYNHDPTVYKRIVF